MIDRPWIPEALSGRGTRGEGVRVCSYVFLTSVCRTGGPSVPYASVVSSDDSGVQLTPSKGGTGQATARPGSCLSRPATRRGKGPKCFHCPQGFIVAGPAWCSALPGKTQARKGSRPRRSPRLRDRPARQGGREGWAFSLGARPWQRAAGGMGWRGDQPR